MAKPNINFQYQVYPELTEPNGYLPNHKGAQACWYFYTIAEMSHQIIGTGPESQIILESDLWMDTRYEQQARTVAMMYQLESPDEFLKFWPAVIAQANLLGYPAPREEYMRPLRLKKPT